MKVQERFETTKPKGSQSIIPDTGEVHTIM